MLATKRACSNSFRSFLELEAWKTKPDESHEKDWLAKACQRSSDLEPSGGACLAHLGPGPGPNAPTELSPAANFAPAPALS
mmetsp:Transcript_40260/g.72304  ORF Transcript_40260/g.72304 Transcript_40260/m.72304 type:complete len:81 (-) Transcript_40260:250-492(-)